MYVKNDDDEQLFKFECHEIQTVYLNVLSLRTAEEAYTCVEGKTWTTCGEAATEFIHHYLEATMQPLMRDVTCNHSEFPFFLSLFSLISPVNFYSSKL